MNSNAIKEFIEKLTKKVQEKQRPSIKRRKTIIKENNFLKTKIIKKNDKFVKNFLTIYSYCSIFVKQKCGKRLEVRIYNTIFQNNN